MDVIPPLGSGGKQAESVGRNEDSAAIPQFDLGEKILAEQRRLTATRRRAPGAIEIEPGTPAEREHALHRISSHEGPTREQLLQLQRIVADIVARDIERLCCGPTGVASGMKKDYGVSRSPSQK